VSDPIAVLDAGVIDQLTTNREFRWVVRTLVSQGWNAVIPTVVLAECLTGRAKDAPANQAINRTGTEPTDEATARVAGQLRASAERAGGRRSPGGIDAIVAAHAVVAGPATVFTTDPTDLKRLLADHPKIRVEKP
jgi:predicted nucleic acid-binding protein